ncbi:MAG: type II secretion system F family protein [Betaproteobacteria bacterium]|nr:type II secretion system F family protein [Betaproteobacteria bacterium]MDH3435598.1 type II secretion system F family protein [Betaproteobacteria bacterium]
MPTYEYKAVDRGGRPARGGLEAVNEVDLELRLRRMGLDLITYKQVERETAGFRSGKITRQDLINFCFDMEQMYRSGIPIMDGLRDLRDSSDNARFREVLTSMTEDMEGGRVLSQCTAAHPSVFDNVFTSLLRAGEQSGRIAEVFENLAASLRWQDELASQTKRLLIYPAMVLVVVLAVVVFLLIYLVPQITSLLKTMGMALPMQTRALIFVSNAVIDYWPFLFGVPVAAAVALVLLIRRNPKAAYLWDHAKLRLPFLGPILQKIILARFSNFFALMYQSGITVLDALKTSEDIVGNRVVADALMRAGQQINAGETLTEAFRNLGIFPPLVIRMLRVGEATGAIDASLKNVNYFYTRDVREAVDNGLKLLEPSLTLGLGVVLAFIMWSVLSPVYDILGKMKF